MKQKSSIRIARRDFLRRTVTGAAVIAGMPMILPARVLGLDGQTPPSEKVNLAAIGVGGMGGADIDALARYCNLVALCDVDARQAANSFKRFPDARQFRDFRKMFDTMEKSFEAVLVATPDHFHAVAAMAAIKHRKHVYCEKPLAHSVYEVRQLMKAAKEYNVVTQLGNQGHSFGSIRDFKEWIQDGAIGKVHTIHCGCNAVNSGIDQLASLKEQHAVPEGLDWDLWLGPAQKRPYHPAYLPGSWRGWVPFGNGTIGDWACHVVDPVFWALDLGIPKSVMAQVKDYDFKTQGDAFPKGEILTYEFAARGDRGPITMHWYSGTEPIPRPPEMDADEKTVDTGAVVMGDKGTIVYGSHGAGNVHLIPAKKMDEYKRPKQTIPRVKEHHEGWIEAIRKGGKSVSDFSYGGPLTEVAMLGVIAIKVNGKKLEWDAEKMQFTNSAEANQYVKPDYRAGWEL
jgi:predicted dehydrogenase